MKIKHNASKNQQRTHISYNKHHSYVAQRLKDSVVLVDIDGRVEREAVVLLKLAQVVLVVPDKLHHHIDLKNNKNITRSKIST